LTHPAEHANHEHDHGSHAPRPARLDFHPLASTGGARLARVGVALAVLWAAVSWALWS
jgi:hypothetical protein